VTTITKKRDNVGRGVSKIVWCLLWMILSGFVITPSYDESQNTFGDVIYGRPQKYFRDSQLLTPKLFSNSHIKTIRDNLNRKWWFSGGLMGIMISKCWWLFWSRKDGRLIVVSQNFNALITNGKNATCSKIINPPSLRNYLDLFRKYNSILFSSDVSFIFEVFPF